MEIQEVVSAFSGLEQSFQGIIFRYTQVCLFYQLAAIGFLYWYGKAVKLLDSMAQPKTGRRLLRRKTRARLHLPRAVVWFLCATCSDI